ncbi:Pentatricopeptide repeat-containing protein [Vitis vinifera]|uniref:Pentatricopeptide repeat-containing protein n=1 Tax=Vitis vinifera TaxID=29760 RepID=A0A438KHV0_VITVI|nr:Pentatricopeptide repeat-containing protein [Vitis vinifera]
MPVSRPLGFRPPPLHPSLQAHVFICNSLIRAFSHNHTPHTPFSIYTHMHSNSILPNNFTFPFLLKSLADFKGLSEGQCIHTHVVKLGQFDDIYVQNSLLNVYASCGDMGLCMRVFDEMPHRDVVSWTVLITGYRSAERYDDALIAFEQMQYAGVVPNHVTMVNALSACADFGALEMGVWIHEFIRRSGWEFDVILGTSLIDMYGKCGRIEEGLVVFRSMKEKNVFTWNSLIKGLALARITQGWCKWDGKFFGSLTNGKYGFSPGVKHYACVIDLLARAGILQEAMEVMTRMPFEPNKVMWGAFLAGCRAHGDLELSEFAARKLVELEPGNGAYYVLLSNIYAEMGRWSDVEKVRRLMKEGGLTKDLGCSSIELEPQERVYELLAE